MLSIHYWWTINPPWCQPRFSAVIVYKIYLYPWNLLLLNIMKHKTKYHPVETILPCRNNTTLSKQYHPVKTIPPCRNNTTMSKQYHPVETIPPYWNNTTLSKQYHSIEAITPCQKHYKIKYQYSFNYNVVSQDPQMYLNILTNNLSSSIYSVRGKKVANLNGI